MPKRPPRRTSAQALMRDPQIKLIGLAALVALFFSAKAIALRSGANSARPLKDIIDIHAHVACLGTRGDDCFVSPEMRRSFKYQLYIRALGTTPAELREKGDAVVVQRLSEKIRGSARIKKAVVLALDGAVKNGELDRGQTEVYVPNEYVAREVAKYDNLLFGASVNPYRRDAISRVEWAKSHGAVLVKWIPSIMLIDPADRRLIPFYRKLRDLGLPLLIHTGNERTFTRERDELADPLRIELPLKQGVKVIAAHIAASGETSGQPNFDRLVSLMEKYPNLYADISALTQINRLGYLKKATALPVLRGRLVYGSDWPLQFFPLVSPWWHLWGGALGPFQALWVSVSTENDWDEDLQIKSLLGASDDIFLNSEKVLNSK